MTDWEDKRQKLLEEGADEDEIAYNRALYDDDDEHDYELTSVDIAEMNATVAQMSREDEYEREYREDCCRLSKGEMPVHSLWDTLGPGVDIEEATMEDIERAIGCIYLNHREDPTDPYFADMEYEESEEERHDKEMIDKTIHSQKYLNFLEALWQKKWDEHVKELETEWEERYKEWKKGQEELQAWEKEHPGEIPH